MRTLTVFFTVAILSAALSNAADPETTFNEPSHEDLDILSRIMSLSFRNLVCSGVATRKREGFIVALSHRPEFSDINWMTDDPGDLARQLWRFQLQESDRTYHMALASLLQAMMVHHGVPSDIIKKVRSITSAWVKARGSILHSKKALVNETLARKEERRLRKNHYNKKRMADRRQGLSLPLLQYINVDNPKNFTLARLHGEALKYRHKYPSSLSFVLALRSMWRTLGVTNEHVHDYNTDPENFKHPHWDSIQDSTSAQEHLNAESQTSAQESDLMGAANLFPDIQLIVDGQVNLDHDAYDVAQVHGSFGDPFYGQPVSDEIIDWVHYPLAPVSESESLGFTDFQPFSQDDLSLYTTHVESTDDHDTRWSSLQLDQNQDIV